MSDDLILEAEDMDGQDDMSLPVAISKASVETKIAPRNELVSAEGTKAVLAFFNPDIFGKALTACGFTAEIEAQLLAEIAMGSKDDKTRLLAVREIHRRSVENLRLNGLLTKETTSAEASDGTITARVVAEQMQLRRPDGENPALKFLQRLNEKRNAAEAAVSEGESADDQSQTEPDPLPGLADDGPEVSTEDIEGTCEVPAEAHVDTAPGFERRPQHGETGGCPGSGEASGEPAGGSGREGIPGSPSVDAADDGRRRASGYPKGDDRPGGYSQTPGWLRTGPALSGGASKAGSSGGPFVPGTSE